MCTIDYRYLRPKKAAFLKKWQEDPAFVQREDLTLWRGEKATILPLRRVEGDGFLFGRGSVAMMALSDAGLAASLVDKLAAMDPERYGPAAAQLRVKADKMLQRQREKRQHEKNLRTGKVRQAPPPPKPEHKSKPEIKKFKPHSDTPHAPKPPRPGSSASHSRTEGQRRGERRTAPSFKPGPGGRKLSGKFRKP